MIYYIDVQPIRKKTKAPFKNFRAWVYFSALLVSLCIIIPFSHTPHKKTYTIAVSSAEYAVDTSVSPSDVIEEVSTPVFSAFSSPLDSAYISSHYGFRVNPVSGKYKLHGGLDLACGENSPIYAVSDGEVITASYSESYGYYAVIDHKNGFNTLYAHCSSLLCNEGDTVKQGDTIALVGSTGNSTGPHLHLEVRLCKERVDPEVYFGEFFNEL